MANLFWISAAQVVKEHGRGPHSAANLLAWYGWTFARADASTCATLFNQDGILETTGANNLRMEWNATLNEWGFLLEGSRTNVVLWNRDLTNAAWVKTNITAVKDQTGIDGVASSASKITASAGNGTCLQAITLGSSARAQFCYIKRLVGTGTINMTMDNGSTWTVVTATAAWTKVTIPTQTLANPTVGFRIVTSGDSVAIDYVQNENGNFESSAIAVTTTAVTRSADSLTITFAFGPADMTVMYRLARPSWADLATALGTFPTPLFQTATPRLESYFADAAPHQFHSRTGDSASDASVAIPAGTNLVFTSQHKNMTTVPAVAVDAGSGLSAFDTGATAFSAFSDNVLRFCPSGGQLYALFFEWKARGGLVSWATMQTEPSFAPRNPFEVTDFDVPGPLISKAQSGRVNLRNTQQIGRTWTERYLLHVSDTTDREFLARMRTYWRNGTIFAKGHVDYATMKGVGGGVPRVKGASQTGSTLIVDGCPLNTAGWLLAGDIFRVQGLPQALEVAADVNTEGDGRALISLVTPIFTGGSPSDNAGLTITGVTLDVCLLEPPSFPTTSGAGNDYGELVLKFSESL